MNTDTWQQMKTLFHAALELRAEEQTAFLAQACDGDAELRSRVEKLLNSYNDAGSFLVSPAVMDAGVMTALDDVKSDRVGQRIGPYEIIREIGHGGMGTVLLAVRADDQYRKQVAIKLVNRGMDTDTILRRFMMERQILANLEHPNIARLLEGGTTEDGLPYFVMEYVEGEPIDEYCEARQFNLAERLVLFRQVCAALHYAHQNLVVHRDIKPRNILVTAEGVPKLLDFGIAKLLSPDWDAETGELTASMQLLMTPAYASPEQLRGSAITTASDIYSLGVVLYELLSGHRPYRVSGRFPEEMAQAVLREEPERPSTAASRQKAEDRNYATDSKQRTTDNGLLASKKNQQSALSNPKFLRGDLDNIVLKALRKEPARRYASVQEMAEDIRRHLEGLPVTASPDTFAYRSRKFIQRNKGAVLAAAVVLITLLSATVITTWQARVARSERDKAERRFNQVRKLANSVLFEYHDGLEKLSGSTPIRQKMLKDALEYLDNLSSDSGGDPALQGELATAYEKVGDVQGNPYQANLGNQDGALESYRKALTIREALYVANRADAKTRLELGNCYKSVGDIFWAKGENERALSNYRKGLATLEEEANPKDKQYLNSINLTLSGIAHVQTQSADFRGALDTYHQYLANAEALLATDVTDKQNFRNVAVAHLKVGDALMDVSDYAGALPQYEKSVAGFSAISASVQNNATAARALGLSYARIASVYRHLEQYEKALEFHLKAIEQQKQAAVADPNNVQSHSDIAATYGNLSDNYLQMKKLDNAAVNIREAIRIYTETLVRNPDYSQLQGGLVKAYLTYARVLLAKGDANGALENYRKALTIFEREPVRNAQPKDLAELYEGMGNVHLLRANQTRGQAQQQGEYFKEAKDWYQKSLDAWHALDQQGKVSGEDRATSDEITKKIGQCAAGLLRLKVRS